MYKKAITVAKISLSQMKNVYIITGIVVLAMVSEYITTLFVPYSKDNIIVSAGNMVMLIPLLAAIYLPAQHLRKAMNLGAKRRDFFYGAIPVYVILSAFTTLVMMLCYYTIDRWMATRIGGVLDILAVFGFIRRGPIAAFIQMCVFLMLFTSFVHTLTAAQDKWYGWAADVLIVAIISVFTPIAPLRAKLVWFFNLIIFNRYAILQITACLVLASAIYMLNKPILARKAL